jgi:capsular exopolysaccharide synthesis family protein
MSQIFDALQRSEAERNGKKGPSVDARALDVLQRAESNVGTVRSAGESLDARGSGALQELALAVAEPQKREGGADDFLTAAPVLRVEERGEGPMQCETLSISATPDSHLVCLPDMESPAGEAFHLLGVRLRHLRRQRPLKKLLITSTIPQEGKSMVAANLACTIALRTQQRVVLLEGDLRRPTQSKIFGLPQKPGICEWLSGERTLIRSMYRLQGPGIWILPAGMATGNSLELLQSGRAAPLMEQLTTWFDWLIIDSPPMLPLADTSVWTNLADGILLVARQGTTQKRQLERGLEAVGTQKLIGAVLNSAKSVANTDYYYRPTNRLLNEDAED